MEMEEIRGKESVWKTRQAPFSVLPAPISYRYRKETLTRNGGFLGNVHPDKPILVHLRCFDDACMIARPTSAGYCVLFYSRVPV